MWRVVLLSWFLLCVPAAQAATFTVVIDPGHGGVHEGATGPNGEKEKDVSLAVARVLRELLERDGARVVLTREQDVDVPLPDRTALANREGADLLVSIHCNSMPTVKARRLTHGAETYFLSPDASDAEAGALAARENADAGENVALGAMDPIQLILMDLARTQAHADAAHLADLVQAKLVGETGAKDRGVRQAPFLVLSGAQMPAVLVELGFISHPTEGRRLGEAAYQRKAAEGILEGIRAFRDTVWVRRAGPEALEVSATR